MTSSIDLTEDSRPEPSFDLRDHMDHPVTQATWRMHQMVASWPADVRDEAVVMLGLLAISCASRGAAEHRAVAEYLTLARNQIRAVGAEVDGEAKHGEAS